MKQPRFLHFATHGFFLEDVARAAPDERAARSIGIKPAGAGGSEDFLAASPLKGPPELHNPLLRSGLALAGFNRLADGVDLPLAANDGILTAMEVTGLDLNGAGLAVLSACETGLGETRRGEGVAGLRRAFRIAGARNVLMSLWNVPDQETVWLMGGFYDAYLGGAPPAAALAKARKTVRERLLARDGFDNPRYWAAFVVEGPSLFGQER
jgi:CHAT domain-containing protein